MHFTDVSEVKRAYESGQASCTPRSALASRSMSGESGEKVEKITRYDTTVGRAILSEILPVGLPFSVLDRPLKKKEISKLINSCFRRCGL